jgi:hypothetical protein
MEPAGFGATDGTPTEENFAMRPIIVAASAAIAVSLVTASSFAQTTGQAPPKGQSMTDSFNRCVDLARARGYSASDLDGNRAAARNFVIRCMQGKQR